MTANLENAGARRVSRWTIAGWSAAVFILLLPLIAMQFTDEVVWDVTDFVIFGAMLASIGITFQLVARKTGNATYRWGFGLALATAFLLMWVTGAVGIIGSEDNPVNLLYGGVLAVGIIGAIIARMQAHGMSRALFATAIAQALVPVIALTIWNPEGTSVDAMSAVGASGVFVALFVGSAFLFRKAAQETRYSSNQEER